MIIFDCYLDLINRIMHLMSTETPMMKQYNEIKKNHNDAILFFRLGDFYEMFFDDAKVASKELSLTLTGRGKDEKRIPMCGIPFHASEGYVSKLVQKGYKVAICEQIESDEEESKGPTKREVVRIITPGTVQFNTVLVESETNYLAAVVKHGKNFGLSFLDISTGEFKCEVFSSFDYVLNEVARIDPKEILISEGMSETIPKKSVASYIPYQINQAADYLKKYFSVKDLKVFDIHEYQVAFPAMVGILEYVEYTQKGKVDHINSCKPAKIAEVCKLDEGVLKHLDLFSKGGLFDFLNYTQTSMGSRLLKQWLKYPLIEINDIYTRQRKIQFFIQNNHELSKLMNTLSQINDIERIVSKICSRYDNPRDLVALKDSLNQLPIIFSFLSEWVELFNEEKHQLNVIFHEQNELNELMGQLNNAFLDDVPNNIRDGGIFKEGFSTELDELCRSFFEIRQWIKNLEPRYRDEYEIKGLKVGYNRVFGYYIEIPNSNKDKVPNHFIRKQTLTNAERYITPELKEKETILLNAKQQQNDIEKRIFLNLVETVKANVDKIQLYSKIIASLDAFQSLAEVAVRNQFELPEIDDENRHTLVLKDLWHPMVSESEKGNFIKNNIELLENNYFFIITGPNMAGKSTIMRSVAIAIILTQMGSFVPASYAKVSIVDQLFTRIGANDNLSAGQSTFMVEMVETAAICQNATTNSLILLDEIGRGTSTFDGISIAAAVSEYLANKIQARTFFATHYHELTALADKHHQIKNVSMEISEIEKQLTFSYKLINGSAKKSYGVKVAKMAGLPIEVTEKAQEWLDKFEDKLISNEFTQLTLF